MIVFLTVSLKTILERLERGSREFWRCKSVWEWFRNTDFKSLFLYILIIST